MTLFAAMLTYWRLARANEAVVARAAGISAWQFILPAFLITILLGIVAITLINPLSAAMLEKFQKVEAEYIKNRTSMISVSENGLWLRQNDGLSGHPLPSGSTGERARPRRCLAESPAVSRSIS
jgi:lipopolysaccharide export system permease protein